MAETGIRCRRANHSRCKRGKGSVEGPTRWEDAALATASLLSSISGRRTAVNHRLSRFVPRSMHRVIIELGFTGIVDACAAFCRRGGARRVLFPVRRSFQFLTQFHREIAIDGDSDIRTLADEFPQPVVRKERSLNVAARCRGG